MSLGSPRRWLRGLAVVVPLAVIAMLLAQGCGEDEDAPTKRVGRRGMKLADDPKGTPMAMGGTQTSADSGLDRPPEDAGGGAGEGENRPPPAFRFEDASAECGIQCVNHSGQPGVKEYLLEAVGPGPAVLDYDHDGWMDIYIPDGDVLANYDLIKEIDPNEPTKMRPRLKEREPRSVTYRDHLYRNNGDGTFTDVAQQAGLGDERWSFGACAADFDGDGWTDIFVCNLGLNRLYRNNRNGTFTDVAEAAGVAGDPVLWSNCATAGDFDNDGRVDLFVSHFLDAAAELERQRVLRNLPEGTPAAEIKGRSCKWRGLDAYCGPVGLKYQYDWIFRQQEDGTFRNVTEDVGMVPKAAKPGFTSFFFDYDQDGLLDLYTANDSEENFQWRQERDAKGRIRFVEVSERLGTKFGQQQNPQASMGARTADINQDGILDVFVTNFSHDYNNIFLGHRYKGGPVTYKDRGLQVMGQAVFYDLSWGNGWFDFDNDQDLDLIVANGHVYKEIDIFSKTGTSYEQYAAVFESLDAKNMKFREVGPKPFKGPNARPPAWLKYEDVFAGAGLEVKKCNRGATFFDYDNDGDVDLMLSSMNDTPIFLRNDLKHGPDRHFLILKPRRPKGDTEALGAYVIVETPGGPTQTFPVFRGQSFCGTDDPRVHAGCGPAETAKVTVIWPGPDRKKTVYPDLPTNKAYWLNDDGTVEPMPYPQLKSSGK